MAARAAHEHERLPASSLHGFDNERGFEMLERALLLRTPQVVAMPFDWSAWQERHGGRGSGALIEELAQPVAEKRSCALVSRDTLLAAEPSRRPELIVASLRDYLASACGIASGDLSPDQPLMMVGLDSLMALELKHKIETEWRVRVSLLHFLQRPTLAHLGDLLAEHLASETPIRAVADEAAVEHPAEVLEHIDQLSDEQVDRMLTLVAAAQKNRAAQ
jgi:aryl carrier-like protein